MAFKNEKISDRDREWVSKLVNYESIRAISRGIHRFEPLSPVWTADRDRNAFLIQIGGGGPSDYGHLPYAVLVLDSEVVVFNIIEPGHGDHASGIKKRIAIRNLILPPTVEMNLDEIKQILREALEESSYCEPYAAGGTVANPNLTARWNIKSCNFEFK